jgi:hypothetical protein
MYQVSLDRDQTTGLSVAGRAFNNRFGYSNVYFKVLDENLQPLAEQVIEGVKCEKQQD